MRAFLLMPMALAAMAIACTSVHAAPYDYLPEITDSDLERLREAVRTGLGDQPAGTTVKWSNPETANHGEATLKRQFQRNGQPCRDIRHRVYVKGGTQDWLMDIRSCQQDDGTWVAVPRGW
jgi:surface antigen